MGEKIGVLFSGGLDSTFLIWDNLEKGNTVIPIYINILNNKNKVILEKNRIELLHKMFNEKYDNRLSAIRYGLDLEISLESSQLHFHQIPIWFLGILYNQDDLSEIQIGYIMNDDAISYLDDILNIYNSYSSICDDLVPLKFPLTKYSKNYIMETLPREFTQFTISCENPSLIGNKNKEILEYMPCGNCPACQKILFYENFGAGLPPNYKKKKIERAVGSLHGLTPIDTKCENGKCYHTIEMDDMSVKAEEKAFQLFIDFDLITNP